MEPFTTVIGGGIAGLIGSAVDKVFGWLETREKRKVLAMQHEHEQKRWDFDLKVQQSEQEHEQAIAAFEAEREMRSASYQHDTGYGTAPNWIIGLLRLVRPALTVLLLAMTALVYVRAPEFNRADIAEQIVFLASMSIAWWFGSRGQSGKK